MRSSGSVALKLGWLFSLVVSASLAFGSDPIRFAPPVRYAAGTQPNRVAVADLNGDGKLDIVATSATDQAVYVLLGNGDGTFRPAVAYPTSSASPIGLALADFTGDGKIDIAVATADSGGSYPAYMVLPGHGDGTFGNAIVTRATNVSPIGVIAGDFNEDGKIDLLTAGNGSSGGIAYGNGDGTFQPFTSLPPASTTFDNQWTVTAADVNRDGHLDVITGSYAGYVAIYLGNGDGTFKAPVNMSVFDSSYQGITSVAAADINGDGWPDLVIAASNANAIELLLNNGDGTFTVPSNVGSLTDPFSYYGGTTPAGIVFADFNRDGKLDVAFPDFNRAVGSEPVDNFGITVMSGGGSTGGFDEGSGLEQFDAGNHAGQAAVGDFNGDGLPDIVTADAQDNAVSVLINGAAIHVSVVSSQNPALPGQSVTLSSHVEPANLSGVTPTGTVTFIDNTTIIGSATVDASGNASITTSFSLPATRTSANIINALYSGDTNYTGSSAVALYEQVGYPTTTTITTSASGTVPASSTITLSANVSSSYGSPTGTVYFYDGSTRIGTATYASGTVTMTTQPLSSGTHVFKALYSPDSTSFTAGMLTSSATATVAVGVATTTTLSAPGTVQPGANITMTATVTGSGGVPTGNVSFLDGTTVIGTAALSNGTAQLSTNTLAAGTHHLTAQYAGDSTFSPSTSTSVSVGVQYSTTLALSAPANATAGTAVTLSATVTAASGVPTGSVTFSDSGTAIGTASLNNGAASLTVANISAGAHTFTASYSGDTSNATSTASVSPIVNIAPDFSVTLPPNAAVTLKAGATATLTISVAPQPGGFSSPVQFSCTGLPAQATCSFSPSTVTPGNAAATTTVTISTVAPSSTNPASSLGLFLTTILPLGTVMAGSGWKLRKRRAAIVLAVLCTLAILVACGGGSSTSTSTTTVTHNPGTPAGTSTVTVTAQSGQTSHSSTFTLSVQ